MYCLNLYACRGLWPQSDLQIKAWKLYSGNRLTKAYDVTILRYRKPYAKIKFSKMHILWCMCSKMKKEPFEISHNILNPYTTTYAFYDVLKIWRIMISYSY